MSKLFNSKATIIYWGLSDGFNYNIHFDTADGIYKLDCEKNFGNPIEAHDHAMQFLKDNDIKDYEEDWSNLK